MRDYDKDFYDESGFGHQTETKSFGPDLFQDMIASQYSDQRWDLSQGKKDQLMTELKRTFDDSNSE